MLPDERARRVRTASKIKRRHVLFRAPLGEYSRHELEERDMSESTSAVLFDEIVPPRRPWGRVIKKGQILRLVNLEGQQAVDFLCYDADSPADRYSSMNTIKVQGNIYVGIGTVLYADSGNALFTVVADTFGRHDTIYGCCSRANNQLRYGVQTTETCYDNFTAILAQFDLDQRYIVSNVNFFMSVPIDDVGKAGIDAGALQPGHYVDLRAERDVLAVLSNCPQMHNACNGYNPTPIRVIVRRGP